VVVAAYGIQKIEFKTLSMGFAVCLSWWLWWTSLFHNIISISWNYAMQIMLFRVVYSTSISNLTKVDPFPCERSHCADTPDAAPDVLSFWIAKGVCYFFAARTNYAVCQYSLLPILKNGQYVY